MGDWDSAQYERFARERTQPARDLIARLRGIEPRDVLDIGCGPGNSTAALAEAFPHAEILGIDASSNMLARARASHPELSFARCVVPAGLPDLGRRFDLVFSNACIHWIPGQEELVRSIFRIMRPGAALAVQLPLTQRAPFYRVLAGLVAESRWHDRMGSVHSFHNLSPEGYYDLLCRVAASFDIWETTYYHRVASVQQVLEWYRGSGLRPYLERLTVPERTEFESELLARLAGEFPVRADGAIILKMPRLFLIATAAGEPMDRTLDEEGLLSLLDQRDIPYELHRHKAVYTVADAEALGLPAGALPLKNLFLRDDRHTHYWLVCLPADKTVDLKDLRAKLGSRRLSFASERDLEDKLGVCGGSVTPLAILNDRTAAIPLVLDDTVRGCRIHAHPLTNTATIYIEVDDVERLAREHGNPVVWLTL